MSAFRGTLACKLALLAAAALVLAGCGPDPIRNRFDKAAQLLDRGQAKQAAREIDAAIRLDRERVLSYETAIGLYADKRMWSEAWRIGRLLEHRLPTLSKSERMSKEERALRYLQLGNLYDQADDFQGAERVYKCALKLHPGSPGPLNNLGYLYADEGVKLPEALRLTREAVRLAPDDGNTVDSLGWVQYKLGNYSAAARTLRRAVELAPDSAELRYHLGAAYAKLGREVEARVELEKALTLQPTLREPAEVLRFIQK